MSSERAGTWVINSTAGEQVRAFVPRPLPPEPPLTIKPDDFDLLERANRAVGRLDGLSSVLPNTTLFVYMFVRKEAILSSQVEGTQSSMSDLLLHEIGEAPGAPIDDVIETSHYVAALEHGLHRLRTELPVSMRLIKEVHEVLLAEGRGSDKLPGQVRRSQNWVGGTRPGNALYVPPPPDRLAQCLSDLERFLNDVPERTPLLIKAALAHAQFESIHPFLDGNGRLGRLLITLLLCAEEALAEPILYLSLHFKTHREIYYERLQRVRTHGEWEEWVRFFLEGVLDVSRGAIETARRLLALFDSDREKLQGLGRAAGSALRVHEAMQKRPILPIRRAAELTAMSEPTAAAAIERMQALGLIREVTGRRRGRLYSYATYLSILAEGTEQPERT